MSAREVLRTAWERAVRALDARALTKEALRDGPRERDGRVTKVIGAGKAAVAMASGVGVEWIEGIVVTKNEDVGAAPRGIEVRRAGHPLPDERSVAAAQALVRVAEAGDEPIVALWSGGASALAAWPAEGVTLADKVAVTGALSAAGASIQELNCVRKQLSRIKGGRLGRLLAARGGRVIAIMLSDVLGDDPSTIGGGPFVADPTTRQDALRVLRERGVVAPPAVQAVLEAPEGAPHRDPLLARVEVRVVGGNDSLVDAAVKALEEAGVEVAGTEKRFAGSVEELAARLSREAEALAEASSERARAVVIGGEPTIALPAGGQRAPGVGVGRGGRAQHVALLVATALAGRRAAGISVLCAASDGSDGPTGDAGAIVDAGTCARAASAGVDCAAALAGYDSGTALEAAGDLLPGGATGTNACDLYVVLAASSF